MFEDTPMLSSLKHLSLRGNMRIPQFEIETMPLLKSLMVDSISSQFLTSIGKHESLTEFSLENCQLSEDQVRLILSNNKLKSLHLLRNNLTNQDIAYMANNSSIEILRLRQPTVTEDGLVQVLRGNNTLKELYIENAACTESFFDTIAETDQLEHLQCSTPVECFKYGTDAIKNCKNMKSFKFIRCARSN
jgi:Leucine-rich repeat (LRR) protein